MSNKRSSLPVPITSQSITAFDLNKRDSVMIPQGDFDLFDSEEDETVSCMYCSDLISEDVIEAHLAKCPKRANLAANTTEEIKGQIHHLKSFLESNAHIGDKKYSEIMISKCSVLLENSQINYETSKTASDSIREILEDHNIGKYQKICAEQLLFMSNELMKISLETERKSNPDSFTNRVDRFKRHLAISTAKENLTVEKTTTSFRPEARTVSSEKDLHSPTKTEYESNQQKYFYALCIKAKGYFKKNDPAHTVQISKLFEKAQRLDVPGEDWTIFIHQELKNPFNWEIATSLGKQESEDIFMTSPARE